MNASDRPQAGTLSDSSPELMPSLGSNKMPPRPKEIVAAHEKYNKTDKYYLLETLEDTAIASSRVGKWTQFAWLSSTRGVVEIRIQLTLRIASSPKIHKLIKPIKFETAAEPVVCDQGATVKYGTWDVPLDVSLSPGALLLFQSDNASWGQECHSSGSPGNNPA